MTNETTPTPEGAALREECPNTCPNTANRDREERADIPHHAKNWSRLAGEEDVNVPADTKGEERAAAAHINEVAGASLTWELVEEAFLAGRRSLRAELACAKRENEELKGEMEKRALAGLNSLEKVANELGGAREENALLAAKVERLEALAGKYRDLLVRVSTDYKSGSLHEPRLGLERDIDAALADIASANAGEKGKE